MKKQICAVLLSLAVLFLPVADAQATQLNSTPTTVSLSFASSESISLSATPGTITFTYNSATGTGTASGPISVTTNWTAGAGRVQVGTLAWFSSATAAF